MDRYVITASFKEIYVLDMQPMEADEHWGNVF